MTPEFKTLITVVLEAFDKKDKEIARLGTLLNQKDTEIKQLRQRTLRDFRSPQKARPSWPKC